jgi:rSAM/selenodomain-associated transferase 1
VTGAALIVIAKDPRPGRSKTRLCPPCLPAQAADLAEAALRDTLEVVRSVGAHRHVLLLDGDDTRWREAGFEILAQRGAGLDERLEHGFAEVGCPALLVGMDTPQLTGELLREGLDALGGHAAVLGPACDGGYWSVGMSAPAPGAFRGVAMSTQDTLTRQRERFDELGLSTYEQATLRDIDTIADAHAVAAEIPGSRFAAALRELG